MTPLKPTVLPAKSAGDFDAAGLEGGVAEVAALPEEGDGGEGRVGVGAELEHLGGGAGW